MNRLPATDSPYIMYARRQWPYLPAEAYVILVDLSRKPDSITMPAAYGMRAINIPIIDVHDVKMGIGFDYHTGQVILIVDQDAQLGLIGQYMYPVKGVKTNDRS